MSAQANFGGRKIYIEVQHRVNQVWLHACEELARFNKNRLIIPRWDLPVPRIDDLSGATEAERRELAELNAYLDGKAAVALAGQNLASVLPLVQAEAAKLGVVFDAATPGARDALLSCLPVAHAEIS